MSKKENTPPSWISKLTDIEKPLEVEAFSAPPEKADLRDFNGHLIVSSRTYDGGKVAFASRLDADLYKELKACSGSMNANLNAALRYAINDLKQKNKTLYS